MKVGCNAREEMFLDRSLGALFGFVRGSLLICLVYIFVVGFVYDEKPEWIEGRSVKLVEIGSSQLMKLNPKKMDMNFDIDALLKKTQGAEDGYSDADRQRMEDLIKHGITE